MRSRIRPRSRAVLLFGAFTCALTSAPTLAATTDDDVRAAARAAAQAYDAGRCNDVLARLGALSPEGVAKLDGVSHYRWGFCEAQVKRADPKPRYETSIALLAKETAKPDAPLEAHFYRVNGLLNLQRTDDARKAAALAIERHKGGSLTVGETDADGWFRLGKLYRDGGDEKGALGPFARALDASEKGSVLNTAYIERIADAARTAGDLPLAQRASAKLEERRPTDPQNALRRGRDLLAAGDLGGARQAFNAARPAGGEIGMSAQYASMAIDRIAEIEQFGLQPAETLADGTPIPQANLEQAIVTVANRARKVLDAPAVEVARKKRPGTRLAPSKATAEELRLVQAEFCGILKQAVISGAPLREWSIQYGLAPLIHHEWSRLYRENAEKRKADAAKPPVAATPAAPSKTPASDTKKGP